MRVKRLSFGALSLLLLASCGGRGGYDMGGDQTPKEYPVMELQEQNTTLESVYPVTVRGQEDIEIKPRVDGFIDAIYVDEGSVVKKGQALFKINSPSSEQAYNTALAAVSSAQAQVNTAKLNVDRLRPLAEKEIISQVQLQTMINTQETAEATLAQSRATLANAQATLGWTTVTSPVDGVVGSIPFRLGSLVNSANTLTTVANISTVYAYFSLNEKELMDFLSTVDGNSQAEKIKNMPPVELRLADGREYPHEGRIETITGTINVTTGAATLRAAFPNPNGILRSGISGNISIPRELDDVFVIPQKATFMQQDKTLVYKVQGDSVVQSIITVLPTPDGQHYAVTGGLKSGERIVSDGIITLSNGRKIKVN